MSSFPKYARRKDANQGEIVDALKAVGASVIVLHLPDDLFVGYHCINYIIRIKDGNKPPSARKRTPYQKRFDETWRGMPVILANNVNDALRGIGAIKGEKK